ncbi:hypothetical protein BU23DRAFT_125758 [Bimuria novae-zelandiae CBS 107.79]|uniref:Uncharacterized protein n=1 Tax=Bimuria novae-zelandiae CBS 107.79 TaxID=1447943 RepID=A0A6A5VBZ4_9PLEO|nr:hypothetical protein BU23DRAFT_125758 [Bimuria novae-zelandiae CBS 107.79]
MSASRCRPYVSRPSLHYSDKQPFSRSLNVLHIAHCTLHIACPEDPRRRVLACEGRLAGSSDPTLRGVLVLERCTSLGAHRNCAVLVTYRRIQVAIAPSKALRARRYTFIHGEDEKARYAVTEKSLEYAMNIPTALHRFMQVIGACIRLSGALATRVCSELVELKIRLMSIIAVRVYRA